MEKCQQFPTCPQKINVENGKVQALSHVPHTATNAKASQKRRFCIREDF